MDTIIRTIKPIYDIDTSISYNDFIVSETIIEDISTINHIFELPDGYSSVDQFLIVGISLRLGLNLGLEVGSKVRKYLGQILRYDLKETFSNITQKDLHLLYDNIYHKYSLSSYEPLDLLQLFLLAEEDESLIPYIDYWMLRDYVNNEEFIEDIFKDCNNIKYYVEKVQNLSIHFIIFSILTLKENLYLLYNSSKEVIICSEYYLTRNIKESSIIINLTNFFFESLSTKDKQHLLPIRKTYQDQHKSIGLYFKEIIQQFELTKNIEITTLSREKDLSKLNEIDNQLLNVDIGFGKHRGIKSHINIGNKRRFKKD